jgi:hypothetical protein
MIEPSRTLVVFGLDPDGNPRAGRFAERDAGIAVKAAAFLGYQVVRISEAEILETLADGNVFTRGNGFIRRVNRAVFDKVTALAEYKKQDQHAGSAPEKAGL